MVDMKRDYDYVDPEEDDPFVSVETCRETDKPEPQVLRSLISTENEYLKDATVEVFHCILDKKQGNERIEFLRCAEALFVSKLHKSKDIESLSKLLSVNDVKFRKAVLRSIQKSLMELSLNETIVDIMDICLKNVALHLQTHDEEEDSLEKTNVTTFFMVLQICAIASMLHCSFRKEKKDNFAGITKRCETIEKIWNSGISKKRVKTNDPIVCQMVKGAIDLLGGMGKFKFGKHLKDLFLSLNDAFSSSEHEMAMMKIGTSGSVVEQYIVTMGILLKMKDNPKHMCETLNRFLQPILCQKHIEKKWTIPEFQQLGCLIICGSAFITRKFSQIEMTHLHNTIDVCANGLTHNRVTIPEEISDLVLSVKSTTVQFITSCLNISEGTMTRLAESYIERAIPGLVVHNQNRRSLPKMNDHTHWIISGGRLFLNCAQISILVPGIANTQFKNVQNSIENEQKVNEFEILYTLQRQKTHSNIVKMLAFNPRNCRLPFYVIENYQTNLTDKLLYARARQESLSEEWIKRRLLEIASAIDYLHQKKVIHRDITLNSIAIKEFSTVEYEKAVLCSLHMACSSENEKSTNTGLIGDIHGECIATRWSAPESIWEGRYDAKTDIWMFGHLIHAVHTYGCEPYTELYSETTDDIMAKVVSCGLKPYKWPCIPLSYHEIASKCLHFDWEKRPNMHFISEWLREKKNEGTQLRISKCEHEPPTISEKQRERGHQPERGIPLMVEKMKEMAESTDKRESYFEIKRRVPQSPNPDYAPLPMTICLGDIQSPDEPKISRKRFDVEVEEAVTVEFHDKILPKMSEDFAEKMSITTWPPVKHARTLQGVNITLKYSFPMATNIMNLASSYSVETDSDKAGDIVLQVACLVERMHEKRWIIVDLTGKYVYIQEEDDCKACMLRIGRMVRLPLDNDSVVSSRKLEDIMYWLPIEAIGHGELSKGSDVYTMAMLFYEFFMAVSGNDRLQSIPFAFKRRSQIMEHLHEGHFPDKPPACPLWLYEEVMKPCWDQDRTCRPTASEVVQRIKMRRNPLMKNYERSTVTDADTMQQYDRINKGSMEGESPGNEHHSAGSSDDSYVDVRGHNSTGDTGEQSVDDEPINETESSTAEDYDEIEDAIDTYTSSESAHCSHNGVSLKLNTSDKRNKKSQDYKNVIRKDFLDGAQRPQENSIGVPDRGTIHPRGLIDVPDYQLFSSSDQLKDQAEQENSFRNTPDYENGTMLFSRMDMTKPQPFKSKRPLNSDQEFPQSSLNMPFPHVCKENPLFQSDTSSYSSGQHNPAGGLRSEIQLPTRASTDQQYDSSDESGYENEDH